MTEIASDEAVVAAAQRWCELVSRSDAGALETVVTAEFTCRRADGATEDRSAWLTGVRDNARTAEISEPSVWRYGPVAVLTFHQRQSLTCTLAHLQEHGVGIEPGDDSPDELTMLADLEALQIWTADGDRLVLASHEEWLEY